MTSGKNRYVTAALSVWFALFTVTTMLCVYFANNHFAYTLDDPYIHLAVARNILLGGYGINLGEYSSPSSSILWPWLMAVTEAIGLGAYGPLVVNTFAAAATVIAGTRLLWKQALVDPRRNPFEAIALALIVILVTSSVALPLTGMEHSLHVLTVVIALDGLIDTANGRKPSVLVAPAIAIMALIRFEGLAFALTAMLTLLYFGERRTATIAAVMAAFGLVAYALFTSAHGLPFFPSSVLVKSTVVASIAKHSVVDQVVTQVKSNLSGSLGVFSLLALTILAGVAILFKGRDRRVSVVLAACALPVMAHLLLGRNGWFYRYEVYVVTLAAFALLYAVASMAGAFPAWRRILIPAAIVICAIQGQKFAQAIAATPLASRNIQEQQYQLRRLVHEFYRHPVAVNDLGLIGYGNPNYVLDLFGLGSETVRKLRTENAFTPTRMDELAHEHGVGLVMVYDEWFPETPPSWHRIATLTSRDKVSVYSDTVSLFITADGDEAEILAALTALRATLPPGTTLTIMPRQQPIRSAIS